MPADTDQRLFITTAHSLTPAASHLIRKAQPSAKSSLGQPQPRRTEVDFGVKVNAAPNGGPAPESITDAIYSAPPKKGLPNH